VPRPVGDRVSSGGMEPVSIAVSDSLVYVANAGNSGSNYTGFRFGSDGVLRPLRGSTVPLPDRSGPRDVLFDPSGQRLVARAITPR
jgi:DNA-binding beta-propeller fold protein YncE